MLLHRQCVSSDRRHCLGGRSCCAGLRLLCAARDTVAAPCSRAHGPGGKNPCSTGRSAAPCDSRATEALCVGQDNAANGKSCCVMRQEPLCWVATLYRERELPRRQEALLWMVRDVVTGGKRRCCERQERAAAL